MQASYATVLHGRDCRGCIDMSCQYQRVYPGYPAAQVLRGDGIPMISAQDGAPLVANPTVRAGSAIIFAECLRHAILRWDAPYPRLTVFNRYKAAWGAGSFDNPECAPYAHRLPAAVLQLQRPSAPAGEFGYRSRL